MGIVFDWNGKDLPEQFDQLPAGRYLLTPVHGLIKLSSEEEAGLLSAVETARTRVLTHADVLARVTEVLDG